jgi:hypothetical protein
LGKNYKEKLLMSTIKFTSSLSNDDLSKHTNFDENEIEYITENQVWIEKRLISRKDEYTEKKKYKYLIIIFRIFTMTRNLASTFPEDSIDKLLLNEFEADIYAIG